MKIVVTGNAGQVVTSLLEIGAQRGVEIAALGRPALDLANGAGVGSVIAAAAPDVVVNAAAYTAVDKAESEPDLAMAVNGSGAGAVAEACSRLGVPLIQLSTDYVYDGSKSTPYIETDPVAPVSSYGRSKLEGERQVAVRCPRRVILRTAWVFSPFGANFAKTMLRVAGTRPELGVVDDQQGCPTYAPDLAEAIIAIAKQVAGAQESDSRWGIYHAAGSGETTWCGFAREIFACSGQLGGPVAKVNAITTDHYPTPARRPANSRLDCRKLEQAFGIRLPDWRDATARCLARLVKAAG